MDRRKALKTTALSIGTALSAPAISSLLASCQQQDRLSWTPQFFSEEEAKTIGAICDTMLPKTETPGALELNIDMFIDTMVQKAFDTQGQEMMKNGVAEFMSLVNGKYQKSFTKLSDKDKQEILLAYGNQDFGSEESGLVPGEGTIGFYQQVRQLTIRGYFSSEQIGEQVMSYDPIPGDYKGCIPYTGENAWSLPL